MSDHSHDCEVIFIDDIYRRVFLSDFSSQSKNNMKETEINILSEILYKNYQKVYNKIKLFLYFGPFKNKNKISKKINKL